jgi:hypothetical protein
MKSYRRFEVLLPARFNDGRDVPDELIGEAMFEVMQKFQAVTFFNEAAEGYWQNEGSVFHDSLGLLVVDVADTVANRKWMKSFKAKWKKKLDQLEIWMVSYRIEIE